MRKSKKLLSLALASLMTVSSFACLGSVSAFAAEGDPQPQVLKGDVNKDGVVDVEDATLIQLYAIDAPQTLAKFESGEYSAEAADVDGSGKIDITDATLVQIIATEPTTTAPEETTAEPTTEPAEDIYVLAGTSDWLTVGWDPATDAYVMEKQEDGTYAITVPDVPAGDANFALKVVRFVGGDEAQKEWYGVNGGNLNYDFLVKEVCDVKVTFNPETKEIAVTGDSVAEPEYPINKIVAVGSGQNGFLNDEAWAVDSEANKMTEKGEGVYEIAYDEVEANVEYQVKFAANGSWNMNWGLVSGTEVVLNEANPAQYNAQDNIVFMPESEDEYVKITLTLDLSKWDKITKEGATYTIAVESVEPVEPTTVEPTTAAPAEDVYVLAGSSDWLTVGWDPAIDAYVMEKQEDGTYAITVPEVEAGESNYALKVVKFAGGDEAQKEWYGVNGGNLNYDFMVKEACDVTVTFNPETKEITVTGTGVADPEYPIEKIVAVGSGQNGFLNDESWNVSSDANTMTEKGEGVYEIAYDEVEANVEYQVKFAANGSWGMNWGLVGGTEVVLNEANPAQYNAQDNIVFMPESEDEYVKITLTLDLSKWDKVTKEGATYTIKVESVDEPTTAEPTTVEPTTEPAEPTTVEPATAEPTTVEPTTAPAEDVYVLAGSSDWLTVGWEPATDAYVMEKQEDGTYAITVPEVEASDANYALKVVKFAGGDEAQKEWFGVNGGNLNYDFMVKEACDVTVTFNPETKEITVTGTGVADPEYPIEKIVAVGSGQNGFLNDESWNVSSDANTMTEKGEGVYEIAYDEVEANVEYQVKFAANNSWGMNWGLVGGTEVVLNEANPAQYNAQDNIVFMPESEDEYVKITLTLDLSKWDKVTKEGATYTIKVESVDEPTTAEPTTAEPTTAEPTTVEPTTVPAEPTTVEPTTVEPTTVEPTTAPAEDVYVLAGSSDWLTVGWEPAVDAYAMEKQEDGTYAITVPEVEASDANYALKVVKFAGGDEAQKEWFGVNGGNLNYDFMVKEACDVTVTFNPETKEITVTGTGVADPEYPIEKIVAVGSGQNGFLNDESWNVSSDANTMTDKGDGVYEIVYDEVEANVEYQVKFAANGSWNMNWGLVSGTEVVLNEANPAQYNAQDNIVFMPESEDEYVKITLTLDLSNWDKITKEGAAYTIMVESLDD